MTALQIVTQLRQGKLELMGYIGDLCDRIEAEDLRIHALVPGTFDRTRALRQASNLLKQNPDPAILPPLFGVPVGVKDIFRVAGWPTRAGSRLPADLFEGEEAMCVSRLVRAGAIVIGKTETTEFAWMEPGPTRNPHHLEHTPGGSSSGSAAGVAAGLFPYALGTQTAGSITRPAAYCGVVGFKPSFGRIPTTGVIPCAPSADQVGFFSDGADGVAVFSSVLVGDWRSIVTGRQGPLVLGVPAGHYLAQASENAQEHFETTLTRIVSTEVQIKRFRCLSDIEMINSRHRRMIAAEMARVHACWFRSYRHLYRRKTAQTIEEGFAVGDQELESLRSGRFHLRQELERLMGSGRIDCWISPSATDHAPSGLESTGSPVMNIPWTYAGLPTISLPSGADQTGLPMGVQLVGRFGRDEELAMAAEELFPLLATS